MRSWTSFGLMLVRTASVAQVWRRSWSRMRGKPAASGLGSPIAMRSFTGASARAISKLALIEPRVAPLQTQRLAAGHPLRRQEQHGRSDRPSSESTNFRIWVALQVLIAETGTPSAPVRTPAGPGWTARWPVLAACPNTLCRIVWT
jgi:hypothetical protein